MIRVKRFTQLDGNEKMALHSFLDGERDHLLPYQNICFVQVIDEIFGYENVSLAAFHSSGRACGFLPQWKRGKIIESVPWRDKGGPIHENEICLNEFRKETLRIAKESKARGIIWRDFCDPVFENRSYFLNVDIPLEKINKNLYWENLSSKVRGKLRQAERNNLVLEIPERPEIKEIHGFYKLFVQNRRRLGVPAYPLDLFVSYFENFSPQDIKLFLVRDSEKEIVAGLVLFHNAEVAIDAYSASSERGLVLKANDFLIYRVILFCLEKQIKKFDFGADSPLQENLISYKTKWLGEKRSITSSIWGEVEEIDHNQNKYEIARAIISRLPILPYKILSRLIVK